jgi:hypothetical protein
MSNDIEPESEKQIRQYLCTARGNIRDTIQFYVHAEDFVSASQQCENNPNVVKVLKIEDVQQSENSGPNPPRNMSGWLDGCRYPDRPTINPLDDLLHLHK